MTAKLATLLAVAGLALSALGAAAASSAASANPYVINAAKTIGTYRVGAGYTLARQVFGGPKSSTQDSSACTASWANGVSITWQRRPQFVNWQKACVKFQSSKVTGTTWQTNKGLKVRSTTAQLKKLYPSARSRKSGGYAVWTLANSSGNSLQAWLKSGRVAYFKLVHG